MSTRQKKFDAVEFQRKVRERLSQKHLSSREVFLQELKEKYGNLKREKVHLCIGE